MLHLECACGAALQVLDVYAGGHVICHACGASVLVPLEGSLAEEKFRFHCPHCETRILAKKTSAGKKSQCPSCGKIYIVPDPPPETELHPSSDEKRINLDTDDLALRYGLPFPVGKIDQSAPTAPHARYMHADDEAEHSRAREQPFPLGADFLPQSGAALPQPPPPMWSPALQPPPPMWPPLQQAPPPIWAPMPQSSPPMWPPSQQPPPYAWPQTPAPVGAPDQAPPDQVPNVPTSIGQSPLAPPPDPLPDAPTMDEPLVVGSSTSPHASNSIPTAAAISQIPASEMPADDGELYVFGGSCNGQRIRMDFHHFVVGIERDCDLRPSSSLLSRHHCVFKRDEYALRVRDLGSKNGTFVNGRRILGEAILKPGDEVTVGDITLHVILPQSPTVTNSTSDSNPSISDFIIL